MYGVCCDDSFCTIRDFERHEAVLRPWGRDEHWPPDVEYVVRVLRHSHTFDRMGNQIRSAGCYWEGVRNAG